MKIENSEQFDTLTQRLPTHFTLPRQNEVWPAAKTQHARIPKSFAYRTVDTARVSTSEKPVNDQQESISELTNYDLEERILRLSRIHILLTEQMEAGDGRVKTELDTALATLDTHIRSMYNIYIWDKLQ